MKRGIIMFEGKLEKVEKAVRDLNEKALIKLAESKDADVKLAAIAGLGKTKGDDGFNYLILLVRNPDARVREASAKALGETGNPHAKAYLKAQYKVETDSDARKAMNESALKIKEF
jgi:HEAT repeat protein